VLDVERRRVAPVRERILRRPVMSCEISRIARMGSPWSCRASRRRLDHAQHESVVATFSIVVVSLMLESPTMTCSRRNRSASACGSSRVLMIGRDRVVALDTPSQMCSARWLTE